MSEALELNARPATYRQHLRGQGRSHHRNISALVLDIRDDGPAFDRRGTESSTPQDAQHASPTRAAAQAPSPATAEEPHVRQGSGQGLLLSMILMLAAAVAALGYLTWTNQQHIAALERQLDHVASTLL